MKALPFFLTLFAALIFVSWFAHHTVRTSLPRQILDTYKPNGQAHAVFLGSSLSDAAVDETLIDSLLQASKRPLKIFNCALAGLSGDASYWLILKNWILARGTPAYVILEVSSFPFADARPDYRLLRPGISVDLIFPELMTWADYRRLGGGEFRPFETVGFFLHKTSFLYHNRLNIQEKIRERLPFATTATVSRADPYRMRADAVSMMSTGALHALQTHQERPGDFNPVNRLGYFEDIVACAHSRGVQLIIFRPPFPPADSVLVGNPTYEANRAAFRSLCDSLGIITWDCERDSGISALHTIDGIHLDHESARRLSSVLADKLLTLTARPLN